MQNENLAEPDSRSARIALVGYSMWQLSALDRIEHRPVCYDEPTGRLFQELLMKPRTLGAQVLGGADQAMLVPEVQCARLSVGCNSR